ncbi:MAG: DUF1292 domain-containing protein [Limnochordia bacterium]|jgi:uncharacterized protein YrzB (UPF0473 family)|nr:DUF1292 domain-containing protein [Limnochordia bacterium]MDD2629810.1 DUF1292 domain-containing protein [Limnochordia bacterium]
MHEDNDIILEDEEGKEHSFSLFEVLTVEDQTYAVLVPKDDPEEGAIILRFEEDEEGLEVLVSIENDDEFARVVEALDEITEIEVVP